MLERNEGSRAHRVRVRNQTERALVAETVPAETTASAEALRSMREACSLKKKVLFHLISRITLQNENMTNYKTGSAKIKTTINLLMPPDYLLVKEKFMSRPRLPLLVVASGKT